jgi:hypothetical protein
LITLWSLVVAEGDHLILVQAPVAVAAVLVVSVLELVFL